MPKFELPALKKPKKSGGAEVASSPDMDRWQRQTTIPVNKEILDALDVGDSITVTLEGKVTELTKRESTDYKDLHIGMEISSVECYPETKAKAEKDFSKGYKKARTDK